jgi:hypothetical protein
LWEAIWEELAKLLPQLIVTFLGVFFAFMLDRAIDWRKKNQDKKHLVLDLRNELERIKDELTGKGNLHFPDIWDSAISSGQIRLLQSELVLRLESIYRDVKGIEYEAKRVRDLAEVYRLTKAKGQVSGDLEYMWGRYTASLKSGEDDLRKKIEALLQEKW